MESNNEDIPLPPTLKKGVDQVRRSQAQEDERSRNGHYEYNMLKHRERKKRREEESVKVNAAELKKKKDYIKLLRLVQKREAEKTGKPYFYNYNLNNTSLDRAHERAFDNTRLFNPFWIRSTKSNRNQNKQTKKGWFW